MADVDYDPQIDEALKASCLEGIERDDEAALTLQVEQARLVLYGSIGLAGGSMTAAWAGERAPCIAMLQAGLVLLSLAIACAWNALIWSGTLRSRRISRKHLVLSDARAQVFGETHFKRPSSDIVTKAHDEEKSAGDLVRNLTVAAYILATFGAASILIGVIDSLAGRACWYFTLWPFTLLN